MQACLKCHGREISLRKSLYAFVQPSYVCKTCGFVGRGDDFPDAYQWYELANHTFITDSGSVYIVKNAETRGKLVLSRDGEPINGASPTMVVTLRGSGTQLEDGGYRIDYQGLAVKGQQLFFEFEGGTFMTGVFTGFRGFR